MEHAKKRGRIVDIRGKQKIIHNDYFVSCYEIICVVDHHPTKLVPKSFISLLHLDLLGGLGDGDFLLLGGGGLDGTNSNGLNKEEH